MATGPVDVVHATSFAIPPRSTSLVVTVHDLAFVHEPDHFTKRGLGFFRRGMELAKQEADVIHCPSRATADDCAANGFDPDKIRIIPFGIDTTSASPDDVAEVKRRFEIEGPYVLWTGTKEPRKNLHGLLEAWRIAAREDTRLLLVGPTGWGEDLQPQIRAAERVTAVGFVDKRTLRALYAGAAAFCWPSLREGFGFPVLEAMSQGCPVITSKGTSTEEIVEQAGILVDPTDPGRVAAALAKVLDDAQIADDLSRRGRARAATYTWERTADLLSDAYAMGMKAAA